MWTCSRPWQDEVTFHHTASFGCPARDLLPLETPLSPQFNGRARSWVEPYNFLPGTYNRQSIFGRGSQRLGFPADDRMVSDWQESRASQSWVDLLPTSWDFNGQLADGVSLWDRADVGLGPETRTFSWINSAQVVSSSGFLAWQSTAFEQLANTDITISCNVSRDRLSQFTSARNELARFEAQVDGFFDLIAIATASSPITLEATSTASSGLNTEQLITYLDNLQFDTGPALCSGLLVRFLEQWTSRQDDLEVLRHHAHELRRRIVGKIRNLRRMLDGLLAWFCGISWSRRMWFLLHGGRPPKSEAQCDLHWDLGCA